MKKILNNKGVTLPIVLIAFVITTILSFALIFMINTQIKINSVDKQMKSSFEYAEAGYNKYLWHLNDNVEFYSTQESKNMMNKDISFQDGFYRLEVKKPEDKDRFVTIKSTGWTRENPHIKRTIVARVRKKQFVHHVYVSDDDGTAWWTSGDESIGPLHTNKDIRIQKKPIFYDTVSYAGKLIKGTDSGQNSTYNPDFKVKSPSQPEKTNTLDFPDHNKDLRLWAEKDNMVFKGRTCIYLDGNNIKIRNGNDPIDKIKIISVSSIKNKVIYVEKAEGGGTGKFDVKAGNIFISGELKGKLTIAAENNIYITYDDPTNWYDYDESRLGDKTYKPPRPPNEHKWSNGNKYSYPEKGGIKYISTNFSLSNDKMTRMANGDDMLGLIANNEILILHYGWPKRALELNLSDNYWNFEWNWGDYGKYERKYLSRGWYYNIRIDGRYYNEIYLYSGYYNVWVSDEKWGQVSAIYDLAPKDVTIHAAIFSVNNGFGFEDYNNGKPRGKITLWGNITQRKRLPVGTFNINTGNSVTGYKKEYAHDPRMFYDYPPHILEPTNVGWEIHEWKESKDYVIEKP
ncbi:hypothetical protein ACR77J_18210 [Tissierella praeacuta]|uniref:hypothetical protein n=1 Tax=Tissierella praeacuta TaxID=43131 RepID=UPI003DA56C79